MADNHQAVLCEILPLLKRNPNLLSSGLQTAQTAQAAANGTSSGSSSQPSDEGSAQKRAVDYRAENLLAKRGAKSKGFKAYQTFRVSQI